MHAAPMTPDEIGRLAAVWDRGEEGEGTLSLRRALEGELTDCQRECLLAYCVEDKPLRVIAAERGVCISTVWRHIQAAKRKLGTQISYHYNYKLYF